METEHVDVVVVGAGLAGVGAACHIRRRCPTKSLAVLEAADEIGGTWNLFRYPGIRADSDMQTFAYAFRPWQSSKTLVDGPAILAYIRQTAHENGLEEVIRTGRRVLEANWSGERRQWRLVVEHTATGQTSTLTCGFLHLCTGYYDLANGYLPRFEGADEFTGTVVHPQHWPPDLDYANKRIVVIGSGATAATLVPTLASTAAHVTMLQRSPSYVVSLPSDDAIARRLMRILPNGLADAIVRWKNVALITAAYRAARYLPALTSAAIRAGVRRQLGPEIDIGRHFTPRYEPWEQRVCFVPDADLFEALRSCRASIVTDETTRFTSDGIELRGGEHIPADIIVTATGLNLKLLGGASLTVDGRTVNPAECVAYKGMMLSGVPNLAFAIGYTNASWTLKCELVAGYVCRLLQYMDARGYDICMPSAPDNTTQTRPFVDLTSGYIQRSLHLLPKQAAVLPWRFHGNYFCDRILYRHSRLDDRMTFSGIRPAPAEATPEVAAG
jgi:cation diffusion facilitator CzcD-associated flavoprotein CzcO